MAVMGQIWRPKITTINGIPFSNAGMDDSIFWRGFGDEGHVLLSEKITFTVWCTIDFRFFPFDYQVCELKFGSYRFPIEEMELAWTDQKPVDKIRNYNMNEFHILNITTCKYVENRPSGNFSVIAIQIYLHRNSEHYMLSVGLPSTMAIMFCYFAFFMKMENIRIRLTIHVLCLIILLNVFTYITCSQNVTSYLQAIDIYILLNIMFAIISLTETFICLWFKSLDVMYKTEKMLLKFVIWLERTFKIGYFLMYTFCVFIFVCLFVK